MFPYFLLVAAPASERIQGFPSFFFPCHHRKFFFFLFVLLFSSREDIEILRPGLRLLSIVRLFWFVMKLENAGTNKNLTARTAGTTEEQRLKLKAMNEALLYFYSIQRDIQRDIQRFQFQF